MYVYVHSNPQKYSYIHIYTHIHQNSILYVHCTRKFDNLDKQSDQQTPIVRTIRQTNS